MKKQPVRLAKKQEKKPLREVFRYENGMIGEIPLSFILIVIIGILAFILIMMFMGPCTDSGTIYNAPLA